MSSEATTPLHADDAVAQASPDTPARYTDDADCAPDVAGVGVGVGVGAGAGAAVGGHSVPPTATIERVNNGVYYGNWDGHLVHDLATVVTGLRAAHPERNVIWLAGDSSLDNKHWVLRSTAPATQGYEHVLDPPVMVQDVAYHMCREAKRRDMPYVCVNTSIEESMLRERDTALLPQDEFLARHIRRDDVLVVSVGGNDIALRPTVRTACSAFCLARCTCMRFLRKGTPCCMGALVSLFRDRVQRYVERLVAHTKPRTVVLCMIYYPQVARDPGGSWADLPLKGLGYNTNPAKVQTVIRRLYEVATRAVRVPGVPVVPFPLFHVMDGSRPEDYVARVEPSGVGGQKMARGIMEAIHTGRSPDLPPPASSR